MSKIINDRILKYLSHFVFLFLYSCLKNDIILVVQNSILTFDSYHKEKITFLQIVTGIVKI